MNLHFIAIGGSIMHSLAIALKTEGHTVTGSDDKIYDPAKSKLEAHGLLPEQFGWDPGRIHADLDAVILGMHAFEDNPELLKAQELGLKIYSFPEFIYQQTQNKQRIVIAGSYGKTTITSMIMHVLRAAGKNFDYLVGAQVDGFDNAVKLTSNAPLFIAEGDEYLASRIDPRPKFILYQPHIAVVTGISWDHINVYPTEMEYLDAFDSLIGTIPKAGTIIYNKVDKVVGSLVKAYADENHYVTTFRTPSYKAKDGSFRIKYHGRKFKMAVAGRHNMDNIAAAAEVCKLLGFDYEEFLELISDFKGASSRLQLIQKSDQLTIYKDYAHAPIKVKSTVEAVRELFPSRNLVACAELHTFSSLNKEFLPNYKDALKGADHKIVFINKETVARKRMEPISEAEIHEAFDDKDIRYIQDAGQLLPTLQSMKNGKQDVFLMMSSGDFGGLELKAIGE